MKKIKETRRTSPNGEQFWLVMSTVFGLLPAIFIFLEDLINTIGSLWQPLDIMFLALWYASPVAATVLCIIGIVKVRMKWKVVPILLLILNLCVFLFVYVLYRWSMSCGDGTQLC